MKNHASEVFTTDPLKIILALLFAVLNAGAQPVISGRVTNHKQEPVPFASVFIEGTYFGTVCDDSGCFRLPVTQPGTFRLGASSIGLENAFTEVVMNGSDRYITFVLKESYAAISPVTITAGYFAAGERSKAELLKPRDIGTTAGAPGDIQATIEALPGTQRVGYTEGLFVRGGSGRESQYIIDGLIYPNPYYAHVPGLKQHGRLDPFLFSGTIFSVGGYSAQYGQALSSLLILNSKGLADSTLTGGGIHSYGGNVFHTRRWKNVSLHANIAYNNLALYHRLSNSRNDWNQSPVNKELRLIFRARTSQKDMLKVYATFANTRMGINLSAAENGSPSNFDITNNNFLVNANYTRHLAGDRTTLIAGASASYNGDKISFIHTPMREAGNLYQAKAVFNHSFTNDIRLLAGGEYLYTKLYGRADTLVSDVADHLLSLFTESEATIREVLALRIGLRSEYSSYAQEGNLAPRTSFALRFSKYSQVSFSYGVFYQLPDKLDMLYNPSGLSSEKARHLIANYQFQHNDRTLRVELFHKQYSRLVTAYDPQHNYPGKAGYAMGFELFFRDRTSIPNLDWWISYSYTDSRRKTIIPNAMVTPDYVSKHSLALVAKYWFPVPGILFSTSCLVSTPRNYAYTSDDGKPVKLEVPSFSTLDISLSKPLKLLGCKAMLFCSLENLLGYDKILGYVEVPAYTKAMQVYRSEKRSFFIGLFFNMYND